MERGVSGTIASWPINPDTEQAALAQLRWELRLQEEVELSDFFAALVLSESVYAEADQGSDKAWETACCISDVLPLDPQLSFVSVSPPEQQQRFIMAHTPSSLVVAFQGTKSRGDHGTNLLMGYEPVSLPSRRVGAAGAAARSEAGAGADAPAAAAAELAARAATGMAAAGMAARPAAEAPLAAAAAAAGAAGSAAETAPAGAAAAREVPAAHRGYMQRAAEIPVEEMYQKAVTAGKRLLLSGHSLGGAIATLCTLRLLAALPAHQLSTVTCIGFAVPPIGNTALKEVVHTLGWANHITNYTMTEDAIPRALNLWANGDSTKRRLVQAKRRPSFRRGLGWLIGGTLAVVRTTLAETALVLPRKLLTHGYRHVGRQVFLRPVPPRLGSEASMANLAEQSQPQLDAAGSAQLGSARAGTALPQREPAGSCLRQAEAEAEGEGCGEGQREGQGRPPGSGGGSARACTGVEARGGCAAAAFGDNARNGGANAAPDIDAGGPSLGASAQSAGACSALGVSSTPSAVASCQIPSGPSLSGPSASTNGPGLSASASAPSIAASNTSASDRLRAWTPLLPARIKGRTPLAAHRIVNYRTRVLDLFLHHWEEEHLFWEEDSEC